MELHKILRFDQSDNHGHRLLGVQHTHLEYITLPEQDNCVPWETQRTHMMFAWHSFPFFKLDVICNNDTRKQRFYFANREKPPRAVENRYSVRIGDEGTHVIMTYHTCRPSPKARWSGDVLTAEFPVLATLLSLSWSPEKRKPSKFSGSEYISSST